LVVRLCWLFGYSVVGSSCACETEDGLTKFENKENINQHWNIMKKLNKIYRNIKKMTQHQSKNKENRKNKRIQGQMTPDQLWYKEI
jgi:hypothetical protein